MAKQAFLPHNGARLTAMVQAKDPERIKELMAKATVQGADSFGVQLEKLEPQYQTEEVCRQIMTYAGDSPVYVTNYRICSNVDKTDEKLAKELVRAANCGGALCDVMGDMFDPQEGEMTYDKTAVEKQKALIDTLHTAGAQVLMSSHIMQFRTSDEVLAIAMAHKARGADISKIVIGAENMQEQLENMKTIDRLKQELGLPFLLLSGGECALMRRVGGMLGCCMYLCVCEHDESATPAQPLIREVKNALSAFSYVEDQKKRSLRISRGVLPVCALSNRRK